MENDGRDALTVGELRAELVGWPDGVPVAVIVPDRAQPSIAAILPIVDAGYGPGLEAGDDSVLATSFPLTAALHGTESADSDAWCVPDRLLGPTPDSFYGAVGRVVALSALLEDLLRSLLQAVQHAARDAVSSSCGSGVSPYPGVGPLTQGGGSSRSRTGQTSRT